MLDKQFSSFKQYSATEMEAVTSGSGALQNVGVVVNMLPIAGRDLIRCLGARTCRQVAEKRAEETSLAKCEQKSR
jgi:hypothetical protein